MTNMPYPAIGAQALERIDATIEPMLRKARIPGAAIAVVANGEIVFAKGYGYRDLEARRPLTADTLYPIASTSKAINATLLGMLVDEGKLGWDTPVQEYLPRFRLKDSFISSQVTLRDLITMRTGLPRHDWVTDGNPMSRVELVERLRHLDLSAGFRERYQYNNLTVTMAGHVAEVVTGRSWEELVQKRIFEPLQMNASQFGRSTSGPVTRAYHENAQRKLTVARHLATEVTAPAGGSIYSNVEDMARWMLFNLSGGQVNGRALIQPLTLEEIQSPQVTIRPDPAARKPAASYAMGWSVDTYNGFARLSHGGYLDEVNSEVALFPQLAIGIVSFINFGPTMLALSLGEHVVDLLMGLRPARSWEQSQARYESEVAEICARDASLPRVRNTQPSHPLHDYAGVYEHPGYGRIEIRCSDGDGGLVFRRHDLLLPLEHWHYDAWVVRDPGEFYIHVAHPFDRASPFLFETDADGKIAAVSIRLEPAVAPIRFER